jgi:uncharacterized membrane protein YhaH (DUF805 family)
MIREFIKFLDSPTSFSGWPGGFFTSGPLVFSVPVFIAYIALFIFSLVWVYRDANDRGKSGLVALLLILLTGWPFSFIWWFWLRPPSNSTASLPSKAS